MEKPFPIRVPLQSPIKQLRVEYRDTGYRDWVWRIWLTANGDFSLGTCIELGGYGSIKRVTYHEDGTESIFDIKEGEE